MPSDSAALRADDRGSLFQLSLSSLCSLRWSLRRHYRHASTETHKRLMLLAGISTTTLGAAVGALDSSPSRASGPPGPPPVEVTIAPAFSPLLDGGGR